MFFAVSLYPIVFIKMKIGILTLPLHTNYGGILQAYALQTVLERMGHEVVVFDTPKVHHLSFWKMPLVYPKRMLQKYVLGKNLRIFSEQYYNRTYPIVSQYTQSFIDKYIHRLEIKDFSILRNKGFDAFVVGSDQIWRPMYYPHIENAFLCFAKNWNIKRIAYAVSFGTDQWEYTKIQTSRCADLVQKFNAVSVREDSGVNLCHRYLGIVAQHVLDPTMLLTKDDYVYLVELAKTTQSKGTLLCYILDESEESRKLILEVAKERKLIPFRVNSYYENKQASCSERIQPPVETWLRGFMDAELIITDSFHACVFSILFGKPFIVIQNKKRGEARINSLLKILDLKGNHVKNYVEYTLTNSKKMSDWVLKSNDYLQKQLSYVV